MTDIKTNIPLPVAPIVGPDGRVNEVWWRFFLDIFNRTGGGTGNDGTVSAEYSDISTPSMIASSDFLLAEMMLSPVFSGVNQSTVEDMYVVRQSESALPEMTFAPVVAQYGDVSFASITYSGQLTSTIATGTAPMVITSTTKVVNLNADLLDGNDWATPAGIGTTTPNSGAFTSLSYSGQLTSTVATGTAPLVVSSTTKVNNLNVDLLDGADWASPAAIGTTTPNTAVFTTLTATGNIDLGSDSAARTMFVRGNASGVGGGVFTAWRNNNTNVIAVGNKSAIFVSAYDARPYIYSAANYIEFSAGFMTNGNVGFFGTTPIAKPTVTGSRGGNAALASLLTALSNYGLVTDSTTA